MLPNFTEDQKAAILDEWDVQGGCYVPPRGPIEGWVSRATILAFAEQVWAMAQDAAEKGNKDETT